MYLPDLLRSGGSLNEALHCSRLSKSSRLRRFGSVAAVLGMMLTVVPTEVLAQANAAAKTKTKNDQPHSHQYYERDGL
jgi:hypothetical protein